MVTIGRFLADGSHNVIPGKVELEGTIRTFDPQVTERVLARVRDIAKGVEVSHGVGFELELVPGYPVLMNDADCAARVAEVAAGFVGADKVNAVDLPMAGGEDFAYMTEAVPGAYFFLGAQKPGENTPVCHHPDFDFDDELLPLGMRIFVGLALDRAGA